MPGIFGIVQAATSAESLTRTMQGMVAPLLHFPWYQWTEKQRHEAALGVVGLGTRPRAPHCLLSEDRRYLLVFEGELYNTEELQKELGLPHLHGEAATLQPALVLRALLRWGTAALNRFNGLFQLALWDAGRKELIVAGDRGGLRPIYYTHEDDRFAFAPEMKALLTLPWISREVDYQGILGFLRHGFCLAQRTFFQNTRVLPPGAFALFRRGKLQIQRYWKIEFQSEATYTEKEMQQRFIETWREIMQQQAQGEQRVGLPLSGGVDSRLILSGLATQKRDALTFTIGNPGCKDAELAQRLAETAGYTNLFSPIVASEAAAALERSVYLTDGMFSCFHSNVQRLLPSLAETVSVVYDGITPLDSLYDPEDLWWRRLLRQTDPARWLRAEVKGHNLNDFKIAAHKRLNLFSEEARARLHMETDFIAEFVAAQEGAAQDATAVVDRFWLEEFQPRFASFGPKILRSIVEVRCPFFDKRMLDLVGSLTPLQRSSCKPLQRGAIHALTPALARLPWERTGLPLTAGFWKTQMRRATKAWRRRVNASSRRQTPAANGKMIDYDEMLRTSPELRHKIAAILIERSSEGSRLFDRRNLQVLLDEHMNRSGNFAEIIGRIFTVETWHRLFVRDAARLSRTAPKNQEQVYHMAA